MKLSIAIVLLLVISLTLVSVHADEYVPDDVAKLQNISSGIITEEGLNSTSFLVKINETNAYMKKFDSVALPLFKNSIEISWKFLFTILLLVLIIFAVYTALHFVRMPGILKFIIALAFAFLLNISSLIQPIVNKLDSLDSTVKMIVSFALLFVIIAIAIFGAVIKKKMYEARIDKIEEEAEEAKEEGEEESGDEEVEEGKEILRGVARAAKEAEEESEDED